MPTVIIGGAQHRLSPTAAIGKGGEADVFRLDTSTACKLFKPPDHPDLAGQPPAQAAARSRLDIHQAKLPAFPARLPPRVITPLQLATDKADRICGYTMRFIQGADPLKRYGERPFREGVVSDQEVLEIFQDIHGTLSGLHERQVVIGDFNDLNVLVTGKEAYFIDADSMQFGGFPCTMFSPRFADPLLCSDGPGGIELVTAHTQASDWYAFAVLLTQSLLYVDPYGGIYRPQNPKARLPHPKRPLQRITIFHPEVRYPKAAVPFSQLPPAVLDYLRAVFERDERSIFPSDLLDYGLWTGQTATTAKTTPLVVSDQVTATVVFETTGRLLDAAILGNRLAWAYYEADELRRETGAVIVRGRLNAHVRVRLNGLHTILAYGDRMVVFEGEEVVDRQALSQLGPLPLLAANQRHRYWLDQGQLKRDDRFGPKVLGTVLDAQTMFWCGEQFGLGLTRAGKLQYAFLFDAERGGINDQLVFRPVNGNLFDATCCFSSELAWLLLAYQEGGHEYRRAVVYNRQGTLLADETYPADADHWLAGLRGNAAAQRFLLTTTDEGICRVELKNGRLALTRQFTETAPYVGRDTRLLVASDGLYAVDQQHILHLSLT